MMSADDRIDRNTEAIRQLILAQERTTMNIERLTEDNQELHKLVKNVVEDSPKVAVLISKVDFLTRLLWWVGTASAGGMTGIILYLLKDHV